jgi:hypothetical protein
MSTTVLRPITDVLPAPGADWREDLDTHARVLRAEYLRHRDGARILNGARGSDPALRVRIKEPLYQDWTKAGLTLDEADDALDVVVAFVVGFVIEEQERALVSRNRSHTLLPRQFAAPMDRRFQDDLAVGRAAPCARPSPGVGPSGASAMRRTRISVSTSTVSADPPFLAIPEFLVP